MYELIQKTRSVSHTWGLRNQFSRGTSDKGTGALTTELHGNNSATGFEPDNFRRSQTVSPREVSVNLSPLTVFIPQKTRGIPNTRRTSKPPVNFWAGGISDSGISLPSEGTAALHHPALLFC